MSACGRRVGALVLTLVILAAGAVGLADGGDDREQPLFFTSEDVVSVLNLPGDGTGVRIGTVRGKINGTMTTRIQFLPVPPPAFKADDMALFVDPDGDQILFRVRTEGRFIMPLDPSVNLLSGPFTATYGVVSATGKFAGLAGRTFAARGVGTSPARQPVPGAVFTEVFGARHR